MNTTWLIAVMFVSGVLGGVVNFFIAETSTTSDDQKKQEEEPLLAWWKHVVIGVVAAFIVPLFLNMVSSSLIDEIRGTGGRESDISKLFVLAGFCLLAAVVSRAFIRSMSERLLREVRDSRKEMREKSGEMEEAKEEMLEAKKQANVLVDSLSEPEIMSESSSSSDTLQQQYVDLGEDEQEVLKAMTSTGFTLRSVSGLAKDTGLDKAVVNRALSSLVLQGLVGQGLTSKGNPRWYATDTGRIALAFTKPQSEQHSIEK